MTAWLGGLLVDNELQEARECQDLGPTLLRHDVESLGTCRQLRCHVLPLKTSLPSSRWAHRRTSGCWMGTGTHQTCSTLGRCILGTKPILHTVHSIMPRTRHAHKHSTPQLFADGCEHGHTSVLDLRLSAPASKMSDSKQVSAFGP